MANWDGQVARQGITVQGLGKQRLEPGWLSNYVRNAVGIPNSASAALQKNGVKQPILASQVPDGELVYIHDLHRGYTRYPRNRGQVINLSLDVDLNGYNIREFSVDLSVMSVARHSDKGLNRGATAAYMSAQIIAWDENNTRWLDYGGLGTVPENNIFSPNGTRPYAISGWLPYWYPWEMKFSHNLPITRVVVHTRLFTGGESYHSVGDRSNGSGWNPADIIGRYHQYRYTDLIGINEGGTWSSPKPPLEYERRMLVNKRNDSTDINTISSRKNYI
jgi:hypothetical protein